MSTGTDASKFGLTADQIDICLRTLKARRAAVQLVGVHCHTGSTIKDASVYRRMGLRCDPCHAMQFIAVPVSLQKSHGIAGRPYSSNILNMVRHIVLFGDL